MCHVTASDFCGGGPETWRSGYAKLVAQAIYLSHAPNVGNLHLAARNHFVAP